VHVAQLFPRDPLLYPAPVAPVAGQHVLDRRVGVAHELRRVEHEVEPIRDSVRAHVDEETDVGRDPELCPEKGANGLVA